MENVSDHQAVCAFKEGIKYIELTLKFGQSGDLTLTRMMDIATRYANGEQEDRLHHGKGKIPVQDSGARNSNRKQKRKAEPIGPAEAAVLNAGGGKIKGKPKPQWKPKKVKDQLGQDVLDFPCYIHTKKR